MLTLGVAQAASEKLLSVRSEDPQLALSAEQNRGADNAHSLGMRLDLGLGEAGKTRFALDAASQDRAAPRLDTVKLDHSIEFSDSRLLPLPGKLDLGLHAMRQRDRERAWGLGLKPRLKTQFGPLSVKLGMSVERTTDAARELAVGYQWATAYELHPLLSLDLSGKGLRRVDKGLFEASGDTLTPRLSGRYPIDRSLALRYGLGAQFDLMRREARPDLNLNFEFKF